MAECPSLINSEAMAEQVMASAKEAMAGHYDVVNVPPYLASEDYAHIASKLPESTYFLLVIHYQITRAKYTLFTIHWYNSTKKH